MTPESTAGEVAKSMAVMLALPMCQRALGVARPLRAYTTENTLESRIVGKDGSEAPIGPEQRTAVSLESKTRREPSAWALTKPPSRLDGFHATAVTRAEDPTPALCTSTPPTSFPRAAAAGVEDEDDADVDGGGGGEGSVREMDEEESCARSDTAHTSPVSIPTTRSKALSVTCAQSACALMLPDITTSFSAGGVRTGPEPTGSSDKRAMYSVERWLYRSKPSSLTLTRVV
mmetsp:Transcript_26824/g.88022  ORF Transcript_26824/g.88022 Transcript_26824/m.88022 type:complete len:231 (+) Transcript_26824:730-1422(+)